MKIKICGMRDPGNIMAVAGAAPDLMGFIFYQPSPRWVGRDFKIPDAFPKTIRRVGVFVDETTDGMLAKVREFNLGNVQLHGSESADQCKKLKALDIGVIKAFAVGPGFDFSQLETYTECVDYFLFDARGKERGGNGVVFDWNIMSEYDHLIPWFLSGGLTPENAAAAVALKLPFMHGLDFNSGVEVSKGIKDVGKVRSAIREAAACARPEKTEGVVGESD